MVQNSMPNDISVIKSAVDSTCGSHEYRQRCTQGFGNQIKKKWPIDCKIMLNEVWRKWVIKSQFRGI